MNDRKYIKLIDKNGNEKEYEIFITFKWGDKNYVVYTDNTFNENNQLNLYAAKYYSNDNSKLDPVETDEEWNKIDEIIKNLNKGE